MATLREMGMPEEAYFDQMRSQYTQDQVREMGSTALDKYFASVDDMVDAAVTVVEFGRSRGQERLISFASYYQAILEECKQSDMDPMHLFHTMLVAIYRGAEAQVRENDLLDAISRVSSLADEWQAETILADSEAAKVVGTAVAAQIREALKTGKQDA